MPKQILPTVRHTGDCLSWRVTVDQSTRVLGAFSMENLWAKQHRVPSYTLQESTCHGTKFYSQNGVSFRFYDAEKFKEDSEAPSDESTAAVDFLGSILDL